MNTLYAQEIAQDAAQQTGSSFGMLLPLIMIIGVFYFLIIRPQQKQKKEHQNLLDNLKIGNKVATSSGIIGKIANFKNDKAIVVLKVDETTKTKIEFQKSCIVAVLENKEEDEE